MVVVCFVLLDVRGVACCLWCSVCFCCFVHVVVWWLLVLVCCLKVVDVFWVLFVVLCAKFVAYCSTCDHNVDVCCVLFVCCRLSLCVLC